MPPRVEGQLSDALLTSLHDACLGIDRTGRLRVINPPAAALFELDPDAAIGEPLWDLLPMTDFSRAFIAQVKASSPVPVEQVMVFPGDRLFLVHLVPVRGRQGRNLGAVAALRDMTGVKRIESELDQVIRDISKQLIVPLTTIKGFVETLLEGAYTDPEIVRRFLQVINEETNRLTRLVKTLTEAGGAEEAPLDLRPTPVGPLLQGVVQMFGQVAAQKNVVLELDVQDGLPEISLDRERFRQAMVNLVDNAVKFTGLKGHGRVQVRARSADGGIAVEVADDGIGIPPEEHQNVFEEFYRIAEGPAADLGGTGLGLAVARKIAQAHGGRIELESAPGEGSTFRLILPR